MSHLPIQTTPYPPQRQRQRLSRFEVASAYPTPSNRLLITQKHRSPPNHPLKPTPSPAQKFIDLLPVIPLRIIPVSDRECNICLTPFHTGDEPEAAARLPCAHIFGLGCIARWLNEGVDFRQQCPMCRSVLFVEGEGGEVVEGRGGVEMDADGERLASRRSKDRLGGMLRRRTGMESVRWVGGRGRRYC